MTPIKLNWKFTIAWVIWIIAFIIIEAIAVLRNQKGDTLSEHFWVFFGIKDSGKPRKIMRLVGLSFMTWLYIHLLTGGWV